ncbi:MULTISPECIES: hypothetical protein [unclassified Schaalia]|uniref:hypothetical protein n=1 Tax=unclassified Schaalia TaxID=2691889 RepID=UPI0015F5713A|nr:MULTISPECIES: hypothetical protein [unclassified Schaalia]
MNDSEKNQVSNPNDDTAVLGGDTPTETFAAPITPGAPDPHAPASQSTPGVADPQAAALESPVSAQVRPEQPVSRKMGIASFVIAIAGASVAFLALILAIAGLVSGGHDGRDGRGGRADWSSDTTISQFKERETGGARGGRERIEMSEETFTREGGRGDRGMRSERLLEESVVEEGAQS